MYTNQCLKPQKNLYKLQKSVKSYKSWILKGPKSDSCKEHINKINIETRE